MRKLLSGSWLLLLLSYLPVLAQDVTVSGRVTSSDDGSALPGVSVQIKGLSRGGTTDAQGTYRVTIPANGRLVFSYIGYKSQELPVGNRTTLNVVLQADATNLGEVVVTALGIERDTRSLSYATQQLNGDRISQRGEPNVLNALQGKVSGVQITGASGEAGASTNINIRGIQSFTGNNQPLFVVDGIPISNSVDRTNLGPNGTLGGPQSSNRALDIAPENIESLNVLKGPAAAALYGSRAASGVIVITTKSGKNAKKKTEITVNSGITFQNVYGLPNFQNGYGQGLNNIFQSNSVASWGPAYGSPATLENGFFTRNSANPTQLDSTALFPGGALPAYKAYANYRAYPDNIKNFFNQGRILSNSVNIGGASGSSNYNFSVANTAQEGIVRNSKFNRTNVSFGGNTVLSNKFHVGASVNYSNTGQSNSLTGNGGSAFGQLVSVPRSYDLPNLPFQDVNGRSVFAGTPGSNENPIWGLENNRTTSNVDRLIGNINIGVDLVKGINLFYRAGIDTYTDRRKQIFAPSAARLLVGGVGEDIYYWQELNSDLILTGQKNDILPGLNIEGRLGFNVNQRKSQNVTANGQSLTLPNFYNLSNATVFSNNTGESNTLRRLAGYYGQASFSFRNYAFLELTGRFDKSSTLPLSNNTYFYPAVSANVILSDIFPIKSSTLSYLKVRGSAATVGKDADPYQLQSVYVTTSRGNNVSNIAFPINGQNAFSISNRIGPGDNLKPEFTTSYEGGLNIGLFDNRFSLDLTYYNSVSTDMIVNVGMAASTGYTTRTTNVGKMTNKGIEALLTVTPIRVKDFRWDVTVNYTRNVNEVVDIAPGVESFSIPGSAFTGSIPSIVKGQPYGVILGNKKPTNPDGQWIINPNTGLWNPEVSNQNISNPNPLWIGSIQNTFKYKGLALGFLFDTQQGGQLVEFSSGSYKSNGTLDVTGVNRQAPRVIPGVFEISNADGSKSYTPNNIQVDAQSYWRAFGLQSDLNVFSATRYSLREATLSYDLPASLISKTPFGGISISAVGRNLWYFAPGSPIDPEVNTQGAGNIRGLELQSAPNTRNYGVNLRFTF
ncbi:SusC/RagA family TonB-linked outer membrane protein [Spirosoma sp.]|uniref:SusC/RagA family TonB-linked outer membrane protein n=1 Tax=Spirosoma sp. TaxID=1899569 RepID=UPI0026360FEE|nr:SusC/RagA family TonB-linked outer membrane protein [Spirosoma sp.]MCX6218263.1 SusC/RagA family TonB-linked outer membrane protein [Spirosoma sp.]